VRKAAVSVVCLLLLASCSAVENKVANAKLAIGSPSYVSRCVDLMHHAFPDTDFNVTGSHFSSGMTASTVTVEATRSDVPANSGMRDIGAECHFENGVIVEFHWTKNPLGKMG
jgi:hypothetical protein